MMSMVHYQVDGYDKITKDTKKFYYECKLVWEKIL